jgi:transposase
MVNCTPNFRHSLKFGGVFLLVKYSSEFKIQAVKTYLNGMEGGDAIAERLGISRGLFWNWVNQYRNHGENAFNKGYTNHPLQYKLDVLNFMLDNGTSINETAAIFNIPSPSTILQWSRDFEEGGIDALKPKKKGRPSMKKESKKNQPVEGSEEALRAEIERLRMENAYLKKLNALVQEKEKLQNKTKRK